MALHQPATPARIDRGRLEGIAVNVRGAAAGEDRRVPAAGALAGVEGASDEHQAATGGAGRLGLGAAGLVRVRHRRLRERPRARVGGVESADRARVGGVG